MSSKQKLVRIQSSDQQATLSSNNGDFTVQLKDRNAMQSVREIAVVEAYVPNVFYNVRSSQGKVNNVLRYQETGEAVLSATVPEGQYTISTYMVALKTAFEATSVAQTITVTQDATTQKITLTTSAACIFYSSADDALSTNAYVVGLQTTTANATSSVMDSIPNLRGYSQLYLHSKTVADGNLIDGDSGAISVAIGVSLVDAPFGAMAYKQVTTEHEGRIQFSHPRNISNVRLVLRDSEGNKLDPGSSEISLLFKAYLN